MSYLFNTPDSQNEMLSAIGMDSLDQLFDPIPEHLKLNRRLNLPAAQTELELEAELTRLAALNVGASAQTCFAKSR